MSLLWIIALVWVLYFRTLHYKYCIDDNVQRDGYLVEVPLTPPPTGFFRTAPCPTYRIFMITMHCINVAIIYALWGWCPALLFALHPMSVWGVAWVTGNYYATTTYFCLITLYILTALPNIIGVALAMPVFVAALNSTISAVIFPFLFLLTGNIWGCALFIPLLNFIKGNRFTSGIKIRDSFKANKPLDTSIKPVRFFLCVKVIARYLLDCFFPNKIGLFTPYGHSIADKKEILDRWQSPNVHFFASALICASTAIIGFVVNPLATLWLFAVLALHSQWRLTGQFYAQRYLYMALVGFCAIVGTIIQSNPVLVTIVATILFVRSSLFIPSWRNQEAVYENDMENFPEYSQTYNNLAQYYLNGNVPGEEMPAWKVNKLGGLLFKAESMEPDDWSIKMNVGCFFSLIGQWPACLVKTKESLALIKPLGGLPQPVKILEDQVVIVENRIKDIQKQQEEALKAQAKLVRKNKRDLRNQQAGAIVSPVQSLNGEKVGTKNG